MKENVKIAIVDDDKLFSYKLCDNIKKLWDKKVWRLIFTIVEKN